MLKIRYGFIASLLTLLMVSACLQAGVKLPENTFRDNAPEKVAAIEQVIQQHLKLLSLNKEHFERPVLAKDFATPIKNPFAQFPDALVEKMAAQGIDIKALSTYKALHFSGELTGSNSKKIVNTDPTTLLVIGTGTLLHGPVFSRGPVITMGEVSLMAEVYSKDLLWYGPQTRSNEEAADNIGLPLVREIAGSTASPTIYVASLDDISNKKEAEFHCKNYVDTALAQNQQNKHSGCGYTGLRWNDDREGQYQWCLTVLPPISNAENSARSEKLAQCFVEKTRRDNPENHPAIPADCQAKNKQYQAVKGIYAGFRYEESITYPVQDGLIRYDYNKDKKDDFVFLELKGEMAHLSVCLSQPQGYQRKMSKVEFYAKGDTTNGREYNVTQENDLLQITINQFAHNEGSSSRTTQYRYNVAKQVFDVVDDTSSVNPVEYDGQPYPMGSPQAADMTLE